MDFYILAYRQSIRAHLENARAQMRMQLAASGQRATDATVDELLARNWYRLPDPVAALVWSAVERRQRRESGRPRGLNTRPRRNPTA